MFEYLATHPVEFFTGVGVIGLVMGWVVSVLSLWLPLWLDKLWEAEAKEYLDHEQADAVPIGAMKHFWGVFREHMIQASGWRSARSILTSLAGLILCWVVTVKFGMSTVTLGFCGFSLCLLALSIIDYETFLLPDCVVLPGLWAGLMLGVVAGQADDVIIGAAFGYLMLWVPAKAYGALTNQDAMGHGDFKLMAMIGAWMGWASIPGVVLLACGVAIVVATISMVLRRVRPNNRFLLGPDLPAGAMMPDIRIPFGPYLSAGAMITLLWGL